MASAMKPNQSKRIVVCFLVSSMNSIRPSTVTMPTGRLIRNTQCQEYWSVRKPPSAGPRIGPSITPMPQIAIAWPRCSGG